MSDRQVGMSVLAAERITENDFMGRETWVHAQPGEAGIVLLSDGEWLTVTWDRTGTTTDVHASEVLWAPSAGAGVRNLGAVGA